MDNKRKIVFGPDVSFAGSEAYKLLRTNLMFALPTGKKCQMIGVTSSMRGEGKSTISAESGLHHCPEWREGASGGCGYASAEYLSETGH